MPHGAYPPERLLRAFEQGFAVLWQRAHLTLSDVTLTAIMDRVLHTAVEQFPLLASVEIQATGITCEEFVASAGRLDRERGFSPIADNIAMLRYAQALGERRPTLAVVKTRGSTHDEGTYYFAITKGGIRIANRMDRAASPAKRPGPGSKRGRT